MFSPPHVLFLRSNPINPDPRVEKEARALTGAGYRVRVLGWDRTAQLAPVEMRDGFEIVRLPIRAEFGRGLGNLSQLFRWLLGLSDYLIRHRREFEILHACDFDTILPALVAGALWKKCVVYDIFDFYADHLRNTPDWILGLIRRVDLWAVARARAVIIVDDARQVQICSARPHRVEVIYNSPEDVGTTLVPEAQFYPEASRLRLAYVGLLQVERGLTEMLEVLRRHPEWSLAMAGFGGDQDHLLELAQDLPNVTYLGRIPYERALRLSAAADVLFATYDPSIPNHRLASPNKVFEAMMLGKPVVVARGTNMDRVVDENQCGLVVEYGQIDELEAGLKRLAEDARLRQRLGASARQIYTRKYSWQLMKDRLLALYQEMCPPAHA